MLEAIPADHSQPRCSGLFNRTNLKPTIEAKVEIVIGSKNYYIFAALEAARDVNAIKDYYNSIKSVMGIKEWDGKSDIHYDDKDNITDLTPNKNLKPNDCIYYH